MMKKRLIKLIGGGGNCRITSHSNGFSLIETFNNLALWGEKKFVSELKRTYKFQRGANNILDCHTNACNDMKCHAEDNSPKYRMVGEILSILRSFAVQTRIFAKECNIIAEGYVRSTAQDDENLNRLCNKCAMTSVGDMKENNFFDKVFSRCTSYFSQKSCHTPSLIREGWDGFRTRKTKLNMQSDVHQASRKAAFTLAEVLVTLGIIGVVSAMTVPTLMQNYQRQSYVTQLHKTYNEMSQALLRYQTDRNAINLTEAGLTDINSLDSFMKNYFKIVKDCGMDETACFGSNYKKIDGSSINFMSTDDDGVRAYVLANGASIAIISGSNYFHLDVNGKKGPNIVGRDTFAIKIHSNGLLDELCNSAPCSAEEREQLFTNNCIKNSSLWWGCFGKILNDNWQMNY